jgi:hypothetical protein
MVDARGMLEGMYRKAEDAFYTMLDWLDEHGVPVYNAHDWLEDHGIPPFPAFLATVLLLTAGIVLLAGSSPTYTVMVTVSDSLTGTGVPNATVYLMSGDSIIASGTTDSAGTVVLRGVKEGTYTIKVHAPQYKDAQKMVFVASDLSNASISLEPLASKLFCVRVTDNSGESISDAQVTIGSKLAEYDSINDEYCGKVSGNF